MGGYFLLCFAYYSVFASDISTYEPAEGFFQYPLNFHDHGVYLNTIEYLKDEGFAYQFNNDIGISAIYLATGKLMAFFGIESWELLAFIFNSLVLFGCFILNIAISERLGLRMKGILYFFLNFSFLYFVQLINKDILTIFFLFLAVYSGIARRMWIFILFLPLMFLVRQQLLVFGIIYLLLLPGTRPYIRIFLSYCATSIIAAILTVNINIIGPESLGDGFSRFLVDLNQKYYVGYLFFNFVRVLQYIYAVFSSFDFYTEARGIDVAMILRLPLIIVLLIYSRSLLLSLARFGYWLETPGKYLLLTIVAFLLAWLMNPTINARYVMLIIPIVLIFAVYASHGRKVSG